MDTQQGALSTLARAGRAAGSSHAVLEQGGGGQDPTRSIEGSTYGYDANDDDPHYDGLGQLGRHGYDGNDAIFDPAANADHAIVRARPPTPVRTPRKTTPHRPFDPSKISKNNP